MSGITPWSIDRSFSSIIRASLPPARGPPSTENGNRPRHKATPLIPPPSNAMQCIERRGAYRAHGPQTGGARPPALLPLGQRTATKFWLGGAVIDDAGRRLLGRGTKAIAAANTLRWTPLQSLPPSQCNRTPVHAPQCPSSTRPLVSCGARQREGRPRYYSLCFLPSCCVFARKWFGTSQRSRRRRAAARRAAHTGCCDLPVCVWCECGGWGGCRWRWRRQRLGGWIDRSVMMRMMWCCFLPSFLPSSQGRPTTTPMNGPVAARPTRRRRTRPSHINQTVGIV